MHYKMTWQWGELLEVGAEGRSPDAAREVMRAHTRTHAHTQRRLFLFLLFLFLFSVPQSVSRIMSWAVSRSVSWAVSLTLAKYPIHRGFGVSWAVSLGMSLAVSWAVSRSVSLVSRWRGTIQHLGR